jgi:hypothetical protein
MEQLHKKLKFVKYLFRCPHNSTLFPQTECVELKTWSRAVPNTYISVCRSFFGLSKRIKDPIGKKTPNDAHEWRFVIVQIVSDENERSFL